MSRDGLGSFYLGGTKQPVEPPLSPSRAFEFSLVQDHLERRARKLDGVYIIASPVPKFRQSEPAARSDPDTRTVACGRE